MTGFQTFLVESRQLHKLVHSSLAAAAIVLLGAGSASASCTTNPAICQAICSKDCCDATNLTAPANPEALSKISLKALKAELKQAKSGTNFQKMLRREVSRRDS